MAKIERNLSLILCFRQSALISYIQRQHSLFRPAQVHQETTLTSNFPLQGLTIQCGFIALSRTVQYAQDFMNP